MSNQDPTANPALAAILADSGSSRDETDISPEDNLDFDVPKDLRPLLSEFGIHEIERGVCEDTFENRSTLRRVGLTYVHVYDNYGHPTGLIAARSKESLSERSVASLADKRPVLSDPTNYNSDYLTGLDLLLDDTACALIPPWVVGATRRWNDEQVNGLKSKKRAPTPLPVRCRKIKNDGVRCMLWSSGRPQDDGLCRFHLKTIRGTGEDVERARRKLVQAAPYAVDVLEQLMEHAESEPVRLKASTEILDRAGIRGGQDISIDMEVTETRPAAQVLTERLARLAEGAAAMQRMLEPGRSEEGEEILDAEVISDNQTTSDAPAETQDAPAETQDEDLLTGDDNFDIAEEFGEEAASTDVE